LEPETLNSGTLNPETLNLTLARFLSVVFNPLLMPTLLFGTLLWLSPGVLGLDVFSPTLRLSVGLLILVGTFGVPALLIYYLYRSGLIASVHLDNRAERKLPFLLTGLVYAGLTFMFRFRMSLLSESSPEIAVMLGGITISVLLVGVVSLWWKISAHGAGMGGAVGALLAVMSRFGEPTLFWPALVSVVLAGLVGSARLQLNAHTPAQVLAGTTLGTAISAAAVLWLL
jgi:membrane-associated phospholipid phosphatase